MCVWSTTNDKSWGVFTVLCAPMVIYYKCYFGNFQQRWARARINFVFEGLIDYLGAGLNMSDTTASFIMRISGFATSMPRDAGWLCACWPGTKSPVLY